MNETVKEISIKTIEKTKDFYKNNPRFFIFILGILIGLGIAFIV